MYPSITVGKNSKFFVALCKDSHSVHSYITLGVEIGNEKVLLGSFGKNATEDGSFCGLVFWETKAKIKNERILLQVPRYGFLNVPPDTPLETVNNNTIYYQKIDDETLQYTLIDPSGNEITNIIKINAGNNIKSTILKAAIERGHILKRWASAAMTYKAYSINYKQYLEFLSYLNQLSVKQANKKYAPLEAYYPTSQTITDVTLKWSILNGAPDLVVNDSFEPHHERLSKCNTCRHSAIEMTKRATGLTNLGKGISTLFTREAPLKANISRGEMKSDSSYIFILPLPPNSFLAISEEKRHILTKLYNRLDELILIKQDNEFTIAKFENIKNLYNSITADEETTLEDIFVEINAWVSDNKDLISTHRKSHWISFPTATEKMFKQLLKSQPKENKNPFITS